MLMPSFATTIDALQASHIKMTITMHERTKPHISIELASVAISRPTQLEHNDRATTHQPEPALQHTTLNIQKR